MSSRSSASEMYSSRSEATAAVAIAAAERCELVATSSEAAGGTDVAVEGVLTPTGGADTVAVAVAVRAAASFSLADS